VGGYRVGRSMKYVAEREGRMEKVRIEGNPHLAPMVVGICSGGSAVGFCGGLLPPSTVFSVRYLWGGAAASLSRYTKVGGGIGVAL
jgi:hypothetical protein